MLKIRCKNCNKELESHPTQTKCCKCENLTTIKGEIITALDLTLVEMLSNIGKKESKKIFSNQDLAYQEARKHRKIRKMEFEIR
jgi:DNA polymerase II large subunit